ncbi:helix-turn-helix transcriptional regulator [Hyphococcus sp.]|uniref:helix-turn-helix transcriptional regulator n=1 Tax=Hyphococcus sp. TaxID=2038636 RepID=UPI003CCBAC74
MSEQHPFSKLLSRKQVADLLCLHPKTVDKWCKSRSRNFPKPVMRWGRSPMWSEAEIEKWLEELIAQANQ